MLSTIFEVHRIKTLGLLLRTSKEVKTALTTLTASPGSLLLAAEDLDDVMLSTYCVWVSVRVRVSVADRG
jgi:hypothetical protein